MESKFSQLRWIYNELKDSWEVQSIFSNEKWVTTLDNGTKIESYKLLENRDDIQDIIEQNKDLVLLNLLNDKLPQVNKEKSRPLNKFLKDYLASLSIIEETELLSKIDYYLELYELYWPWTNKKLDSEIIVDKDVFSKIEILFELLYNNTLLPDYKNQKQFNEDMMKFIPRLEKSINKLMLKRSPIVIPPVNARKVLGYLNDMKTYRVLWSKTIKWGLIKQIAYDFFLWERQSINEANEFSFSFLINDESLLSRDEFIVYLKETLKLKNIQDNKEFLLESDSFFNYSIYVGEEMYENWFMKFDEFQEKWIDSDWFLYNGFEVKIYAEKKKNFDTIEEFSNICISLPALTARTIKDIYETYWRLDWEEKGFPEKSFVFNVSNNLNVKYDWDNWEYIEDWEWVAKRTTYSWKTTEIPFDIIDLSKREKKELLLNKDLELLVKIIVEEINNPEKFLEAWIKTLDTWVIFHWPGWVWKSELCYEIGYRTMDKTDFSKLDLSVLFNKYLWESEKLVAKYFSELRLRYETTKRKQISFIDEIDGLISNEQSEVLAWVRSKLLTELSDWDNEGLIFLWTTNFIEKLSWPISRRFSKKVWVELPDEQTRKKLIEFFVGSYKKWYFDWIDIDLLVKKTDKKSHAFIDKLFRNTLMTIITLDKKVVTTNDILDHFKMTDDEIKKQEESNVMWFKV